MSEIDQLEAEHFDLNAFNQILELDDGDWRDEDSFSRSIVFDFFVQAETTIEQIEEGLQQQDLKKLSQLGHFLKGSSAALGLSKIKNACEKIQNLGEGKCESGLKESSGPAYALAQIQSTLADLKIDYKEVKTQLRKFYGAE